MGMNVCGIRTGVDSFKGEGITELSSGPASVGGHSLTKDTYHLEEGSRSEMGNWAVLKKHDSLYGLHKSQYFMPFICQPYFCYP